MKAKAAMFRGLFDCGQRLLLAHTHSETWRVGVTVEIAWV